MKDKYLISNILLISIGVVTFFYLFISCKNNYPWLSAGEGFGALLLLVPITGFSGISCIARVFIILFFNNKPRPIFNITHITLAIIWLILLQGLSVSMENEWNRKPAGRLLSKNTGLGKVYPDTKWVKSDQKIFYISTNKKFYEGALCSIDANGNNLTKIIDNCKEVGFLPNKKDIFTFCDNTLYLLKNEVKDKEPIYTFGYYYEEYPGGAQKQCTASGRIEWSPSSDKFIFPEHDYDTNADGTINWHDNESIYIFDLLTRKTERVNFDRDVRGFDSYLWDKSGDMLYVQCSKYLPHHTVKFYIYSYNLNTKEIQVVNEEDYDTGRKMKIEDYINKARLFFNVDKYPSMFLDSIVDSENKVKVFIGSDKKSLYIQRGEMPPKKIFEDAYGSNMHSFYWLPRGRYIICSAGRGYICILDTEEEKIGILSKGDSPIWYGMYLGQEDEPI